MLINNIFMIKFYQNIPAISVLNCSIRKKFTLLLYQQRKYMSSPKMPFADNMSQNVVEECKCPKLCSFIFI